MGKIEIFCETQNKREFVGPQTLGFLDSLDWDLASNLEKWQAVADYFEAKLGIHPDDEIIGWEGGSELNKAGEYDA